MTDDTAPARPATDEEDYFLRRMQASVAQAWAESNSLAKLAQLDLAGRYSVAALAARIGKLAAG